MYDNKFSQLVMLRVASTASSQYLSIISDTNLFIGETSFRISENSSLRNFRLLQNEQNSSTVP